VSSSKKTPLTRFNSVSQNQVYIVLGVSSIFQQKSLNLLHEFSPKIYILISTSKYSIKASTFNLKERYFDSRKGNLESLYHGWKKCGTTKLLYLYFCFPFGVIWRLLWLQTIAEFNLYHCKEYDLLQHLPWEYLKVQIDHRCLTQHPRGWAKWMGYTSPLINL